LSGRLQPDNVSELSALLAAESSGRAIVLDLKDVVLADRDVIRFLRKREGDGIALATVRSTSGNGSRAKKGTPEP